ncbi:hypothetical protein EXN32_12455 [Agrobacterium tumefaciens]|uniref:hypothetical protein n=1 Tax=Agrobacterium TaxID=357 RepID=UPI00115E4144|nr:MULTISPECIES: hypothetical protein [Agrobacterium]MDA5243092.1 hypothetical protein [Agrobacterium sp. MAFF310724]MDA5247356.1 hypothetical protein [Agrobacterium sp. MAFF210268]TRB16299.1 hypothetical protein EXN32_12455 [Agrobacterium tumefaciens]
MSQDGSVAVNDERELLKRLVIAHADLQQALSAITFLGDELDENAQYSKIELRRFKCFETTFIVSYGRAFTKSNGRYDQLPLKRIGIRLTPRERELHQLIVKLRQTVYAHSDEDFAHVRLDVSTMEFPNGPFVLPHMQFDHGLEFANFYKREAAAYLIRKIMDGLFEAVQRLATRQPETSLYVKPTQNAVEPDWSEILVQNASVTVLNPVSDKD